MTETDVALWDRRPRLRTVLFAVNLVLLVLPAGAVALLRIYENELTRRTQAELITQGAVVRSAFRQALEDELEGGPPDDSPGDRHDDATSATDEAGEGASGDGATEGRAADGGAPSGSSAESDPVESDEEESDRESAEQEGTGAYGHPVDEAYERTPDPDDPFTPVSAELDVASARIYESAADATEPERPPHPAARRAGAQVMRMIRDARLTTLSGIRVVDDRGTVVATTRSELGKSLAHRPEVRRALRGETVSLLRERTTDDPNPPLDSWSRRKLLRVFVALPVRHDNRVLGAVVLSRTPMSVLKGLYVDRNSMLYFALLLGALVVLVTAFTSITIGRPVRQLISQTEAIKGGEDEGTRTIENPVTHEFARLSEAFADMAGALTDRNEYIRTFASNVSHEFKTPLASIRGAVELLEDHFEEMSAEERERFLGMLLADADRLERLVRRLHDLARADVLSPEQAHADIRELLADIVERFAREGLDVRLESDDELGVARITPETLESVLSNLLDNARQHGGEDVTVVVEARRFAPEREGAAPRVVLEVRDDGAGISANNAERIFDTFFTTARDTGGTGLGLSVVRSLLEAHDATIELLDTEVGTAFRIEMGG